MCHNSGIESEQIERCVAGGMPRKVIKSVKYTLRKRYQIEYNNSNNKNRQENNNNNSDNEIDDSSSGIDISYDESSSGNNDGIFTEIKTGANDNNTLMLHNIMTAATETTTTTTTTAEEQQTEESNNTNNKNRNDTQMVITKATTTPTIQNANENASETIQNEYNKKNINGNSITEATAAATTTMLKINANNTQMSPTAATATTTETAAFNTAIATTTKTTNEKTTFIPKMCGRFRKQQQQQQQQQLKQREHEQMIDLQQKQQHEEQIKNIKERHNSISSTQNMEPSMDDALAIGTQLTRKFAERLYSTIDKLQSSKFYTILVRTTQPAHFIAICILSFVLLTVGPDLLESSTIGVQQQQQQQQQQAHHLYYEEAEMSSQHHHKMQIMSESRANIRTGGVGGGSVLATIAYLGAFATHFGSQIWMTFVSGLSLYFSLPRHTFGQCQQILFPKYFALNGMLSILMLIIYIKYFLSNWTLATCMQMSILALTAAIEVTVRLYLAPPMLRLMHEKYRIEDAIGSGQEVGSLVQGDLVQCPHYQRIHKAFRRIHMTIAIGNMIVLMATCLHLYFLASKIQIS